MKELLKIASLLKEATSVSTDQEVAILIYSIPSEKLLIRVELEDDILVIACSTFSLHFKKTCFFLLCVCFELKCGVGRGYCRVTTMS